MLVERAAHAAAARAMGGVAIAEEGDARARLVSVAAVTVEETGRRVDGRTAGRLAEADFADARVGLVPAPIRALCGGASAGAGGGNDADPETDGALGALSRVGGLARAKAALEEALSFPTRHARVFGAAPLRLRTGVLLYGPPGCGKTLLARAAIASAGLRVVVVKGPELLNKYIGQSEAGVRATFRRAAAAAPCALFFDEFDAIAPRRGHDSTGVTDRVVNQLLTELDGVEALVGVTVIGATSRPDLVDPALLRPGRLDRLVRVPFPDREERRAILAAVARDLAVTETGGGGGGVGESKVSEKGGVGKVSDALSMVWDDVAAKTEGFTGADLRALVSDASMHAVHRAIAKVSDEGGDGADDANAEDVRVTGKDVAKALEGARASVPASEREKLARAYAAFEGGRGARGSVGGAEESPGKRVSHA